MVIILSPYNTAKGIEKEIIIGENLQGNSSTHAVFKKFRFHFFIFIFDFIQFLSFLQIVFVFKNTIQLKKNEKL